MFKELSEKAKEICKTNYKNNCDNSCVLINYCKGSYLLTVENYNKNIDIINSIAECGVYTEN